VQVQKSPKHVSASSVQMKGENKSCSSEIDCLFFLFFFSFCHEQNDWHKSPRAIYHHHLSSSSLQKMSAASTLSPQKI
jgi:hypothetical protein